MKKEDIGKIKSEYLVMDEYGYTDKELVDTVNMLVDKVNELNALMQHKGESEDKGIYNDLNRTYYEMKNRRTNIGNNINDLMAKRQQLDEDIARIEHILAEYGTYQSAGFVENKAESEESE